MNFEEFIKKYQKSKPAEYHNLVVDRPLVSICIQTYQHVNYIKECLEGILSQKTDFPFDIILGEDESDDGTRDICIEYSERYPDIIKLFLRKREDVILIGGRETGRYNFLENLKECKGKYIAICEGDDYWTDDTKLQKQVNFLEKNKDFVISSHNSNVVNSNSNFIRVFNKKPISETTNIEYILKNNWYLTTSSLVFRNKLNKYPKWFNKHINGDYMLLLLLTSDGGLVHYDKNVMSAYRNHSEGLSKVFNEKYVFEYSMIEINKVFNKYSKRKFSAIINENLNSYYDSILETCPINSKKFWALNIQQLLLNSKLSKNQKNIFCKRITKSKVFSRLKRIIYL